MAATTTVAETSTSPVLHQRTPSVPPVGLLPPGVMLNQPTAPPPPGFLHAGLGTSLTGSYAGGVPASNASHVLSHTHGVLSHTHAGTLGHHPLTATSVLSATSQIVRIPVDQTIQVRDHIVEVPEIHQVKKIQPKVKVVKRVLQVPRVEPVIQERIVEVPVKQTVEKVVEVPVKQEMIRHVPKYEIKEVVREVPRMEFQYKEKIVEVPQIQYIDTVVEVPQIQEIIREVPKVEVVEVPVERIRHVNKPETRTIEKIRHVPGPIQYVDIEVPQVRAVPAPPRKEVVEQVRQVMVPQYVDVEKRVPVYVPGPVIDVPVEVPSPQPIAVKGPATPVPSGRVVQIPVEVPVEQFVDVPVPYPVDVPAPPPRQVPVPVPQIRQVPVPQYFDVPVDVPQPVPVARQPTQLIIQPVQGTVDYEMLPAIAEKGTPRYIEEPPQYLPAIYETTVEETVIESAQEMSVLPPIYQQMPMQVSQQMMLAQMSNLQATTQLPPPQAMYGARPMPMPMPMMTTMAGPTLLQSQPPPMATSALKMNASQVTTSTPTPGTPTGQTVSMSQQYAYPQTGAMTQGMTTSFQQVPGHPAMYPVMPLYQQPIPNGFMTSPMPNGYSQPQGPANGFANYQFAPNGFTQGMATSQRMGAFGSAYGGQGPMGGNSVMFPMSGAFSGSQQVMVGQQTGWKGHLTPSASAPSPVNGMAGTPLGMSGNPMAMTGSSMAMTSTGPMNAL